RKNYLQERRHQRHSHPRYCLQGHHHVTGRQQGVRENERRRESADRGLPLSCAKEAKRAAEESLWLVPRIEGEVRPDGNISERRTAADACHRTRSYGGPGSHIVR